MKRDIQIQSPAKLAESSENDEEIHLPEEAVILDKPPLGIFQ